MSKNTSVQSLKIGQASKALGVSIDTLRRWEASGKIQPQRTPGGTRFYSLEELNHFGSKTHFLETSESDYTHFSHPVVIETIKKQQEKTSESMQDWPNLDKLPQIHPKIYAKIYAGAALCLILVLFLVTLRIGLLSHSGGRSPIESKDAITSFQHDNNVLAASSIAEIGKFLEINADTVITGNMAIEGESVFGEGIIGKSTLSIAGATTLSTTSINSTLSVTGLTTATGGLTSSGKITLTGNEKEILLIKPSSDPSSATKLFVIQNAAGTEKASINSSGATTLSSTLEVKGGTTLSSTISVSGATTLSSSLEVSGTTTLSGASTLAGATVISSAGAASTPGLKLTGAWYTGGSTTTTKPQLLVEPTDTTSTGWSASGTGVGVNAKSSFTGNLIDLQLAGTSKFKVDYQGTVTAAGTITFSGLTASRAVFTDSSSNLATTGASAALLNALSDETGTGLAVFGTSPTIASPTITTSPTATGATWTDLGSVTTIDINGGTIDGTAIGASSASTGAFTTLTSNNTTNIGNGSGIITSIGNAGGAAAINLTTGTGSQTFTSNVATGTTTTSGFVFDATAITSGTGIYAVSDSVTTGKLLDIATSGNTWTGNGTTNGLINLASSSTAGTGSSSSILLNLARSGANANATHTAYGLYSAVTNSGTTNVNVAGYFSATGAVTNRGLEVAAMTGATSTGLTIGALSGTTANTGINIGAISGASATGAGITIGNISTTGTTNYGLQLGTMTGGTTSNYQISTGVLTSATTTTNAQLNLGGVVTTGGTTNYGINVGALSGSGTTNYGINITALTSTGTTNAALNIGGLSGAGTNNYGIQIQPVTGAGTANVALCFDCDGTYSASTVASGIQFGTDANAVTLYRSASDVLRTGDGLTVDLDLIVSGGDITGTGDESIDIGEATANGITLLIDATGEVLLTSSALSPSTSDGNALGTTALMWADLFLASGGVINFNNGDVTLTHGTDTLTLAGGQFVAPAGSQAAPSYTFVGDTDTGMWSDSAGRIRIGTDNAYRIYIGTPASDSAMIFVNPDTTYGGSVAPFQFNAGSHTNITGESRSLFSGPTLTITGDYSYQRNWQFQPSSISAVTTTRTITNAANVWITGAPTSSGTAVLTNSYTLYLQSGGNGTNNYGMYIENQTGGASDYGIYIAGADTAALFVDAGVTRLDGFLNMGNWADSTQAAVSAQGWAQNIAADTQNFSNASSTVAIGATTALGIATLTGDNATLTFTDAATLYIAGVPAASTNVAITNTALALWVDAGASRFDGQILASGGSQAAPGYSFQGDTDTGMFSDAADQVRIGTGNAYRLYLGSPTASDQMIFNNNAQLTSSAGGSEFVFQHNGTGHTGITGERNWISSGSPTAITITGGYSHQRTYKLAPRNINADTALTITNAANLWLVGAPTGGGAGPATLTNSYNLYLQEGGGGTNHYQMYIEAPTGGTNNYAIYSAGGSVYHAPTQTVASGASATLDAFNIPASTITVSGSTNITTATGFNLVNIGQPTLSNASVVTTNAATLYIANAPTASGGGSITNPYALWVDAGTSRFDGAVTYGAQTTFTDSDATPDVSVGSHFITNTTAVTITDFDAGSGTLATGQVIYVESNGVITYDVTASGLNGGTTDLVSGAGDMTTWIYDGTDWNLISWMDDSVAQAGGADLAEWYVSAESLEPGDVVSVARLAEDGESRRDKDLDVAVRRSEGSYEPQVMGIVSTEPAIILGTQDINTYAVALAGRVPVKVSTENGPIEKGDYLTSSSVPGVAMKATKPGPTVGKALEGYSGQGTGYSEGKILTFVNISFADPSQALANLLLDEEGNLVIPKVKTASLEIGPIGPIGQIGQEPENALDVASKLKVIDEAIATQSAVLASLKDSIASATASLQNDVNDLKLTPPEILLATGSATMANIKATETLSSEKLLTALDANISGVFKALGESFMGNTTIAGNLVVDGTFSISGNSINAIGLSQGQTLSTQGLTLTSGILYLQNNSLAQGLDILNGKFIFDKEGKLTVTGTVEAEQFSVTSGKSAGSAKILTGQLEATVENIFVKPDSIIIVTPEVEISQTISVIQKLDGQSFKAKIASPETKDITFSYLIIGQGQKVSGL